LCCDKWLELEALVVVGEVLSFNAPEASRKSEHGFLFTQGMRGQLGQSGLLGQKNN